MASTSTFSEDQEKGQAFLNYLERPQEWGLTSSEAQAQAALLKVVNQSEIDALIDARGDSAAKWKFSKRTYIKEKTDAGACYYVARAADDLPTDIPVPTGQYGKIRAALPPGDYVLVDPEATENDLLSWALTGYQFSFGKVKFAPKPPTHPLPVLLVNPQQFPEAAVQKVVNLASATNLFRDSIRTRTNQFNPSVGAQWMHRVAQQFGAQVTTFSSPAELREKFLLAYEVGKGSQVDPPNVTILEWQPKDIEPVISLDLVGKGVCFDTGGHNLKVDSKGAAKMYGDKGGACAQMALAELIMKANLPIRLRVGNGWVVNVPGGFATMQSSIHRSGDITVENGNTDAEGRLVMGSILTYFSKNNPAEITITHATLTGAALVALSENIAAMYVGDQALAHTLQQAMKEAQDPVWKMPRDRRLLDRLKKGTDADIISTGGPYGGSLNADAFLCHLAAESTKFVHIDAACALMGSSGITADVADMDLFAVRGIFKACETLCKK